MRVVQKSERTTIMRLLCVVLLLNMWCRDLHAFNHWVVTENGRIGPKLDSHFYLRRPYDLLALLDQEKRHTDLERLVDDLVEHKNRIDLKSTEATSSGEHMINDRCTDILKIKEKGHFIAASNGSDRFHVLLYKPREVEYVEEEPGCIKFAHLPYSMFTYDHLDTIVNRKTFAITPHDKLEELLPDMELGLVAKQIMHGLTKNDTSWVHYNLGLLYWWKKGVGFEAVECARRALYFAPIEFKDIPLLNLGGLLMWGMRSKEAAIVLKAAIDYAPSQPKNHLSLGNVYGQLKDFEKAMKCFRKFNKLQPMDAHVETTKKFIQCFMKLHSGFMEYHDTLQDILSDLHEYHSQQQRWLSLQERLIWEIAPIEINVPAENAKRVIELQDNSNCMSQLNEENKPMIRCYSAIPGHIHLDVISNVQKKVLKLYGDRRDKEFIDLDPIMQIKDEEEYSEIYNKVVVNVDDNMDNMPPILPPKYPTTMSTSNNLYFDAPRWPSRDECSAWDLPLKEQENLDLPIFIPPENKGYQITKILSENIGIAEGAEHDLPWYPPLCEHPNAEDFDPYIPPAVGQVMLKNKPISSHFVIKNHFLNYVNNGRTDEAEIGQRIITAINKKSGPSWVLAMLASMYWRIRSNTKNAMTCLDVPMDPIPKEFTDVILVSMGSMLQQLGLVENALKFASLAFKVNYLEPGTNFLLALIHYQKNNPVLAMYYLKNVLRVEPDYYAGVAERLLRLWACRIKMGSYETVHVKEEKVDPVCGQREGFSGEGVICSASGDQCKTAAIQCFRSDSVRDNGNKAPTVKIVAAEQCGKHSLGESSSLISTLLSEGSGGAEPDQSQLENIGEHHDFHMRIFFGDEYAPTGSVSLGEFYVSVSMSDGSDPEAMLNVYDKSGTYQLSKTTCKDIQDPDWLYSTAMWQSLAARNINIAQFLSPLPKSLKEYDKPHCSDSVPPSSATLDHLTAMVLRKRLPHVPEDSLSEWLGLMASDEQASVRELGTRIGIALRENSTSWILATAAALYWRVVGNTEEAVTCLRQALTYVPADMKDIPLISLANVLHRVGFLGDALEVAYIAIDSHPNFVVNHFTAGNIHTSLGDFDKAVTFYRSSLALDPNFEPARDRLKAILCTLLFDESGSLREGSDFFEK